MGRRILIIDAFADDVRRAIDAAFGKNGFGEITRRLFEDHILPDVDCTVVHGINSELNAEDIARFDGVVWSGSDFSANDTSSEVAHLTRLMKDCAQSGRPIFGICFGLQLAAKLGGGTVVRNPRGREMGFARKIEMTACGERHPMMDRRNGAFAAIADHVDCVLELPPGGSLLAGNHNSDVQAASFVLGRSEFWGVQYHPDMNLSLLAVLFEKRRPDLLNEGFFKDDSDFDGFLGQLRRLVGEPDARDIAWQLGVDEDVLNTDLLISELKCWAEHQVLQQVSRHDVAPVAIEN